MFCPKCSEPKSDQNTRFCTKCGLDLDNLGSFVSDEPAARFQPGSEGGLKQGGILFVFGLMMIPIWMFIAAAFPPADRLVESSPSTTLPEQIAWILMWIAFIAGAARILFDLAFSNTAKPAQKQITGELASEIPPSALPSADNFQSAHANRWKTTDNLFDPVLRKTKPTGDL